MKTIIPAGFILAICMATVSCDDEKRFRIPTTSKANDGWEIYDKPGKIDIDSSKRLILGVTSPEAAVTHFFASKVRGDKAYQDVIPELNNRSEYLRDRLDEYEDWSIELVEIRKRKVVTNQKVLITIFMTITVDGNQVSAEDEVTVEKFGGKWLVTSIPS